MSFCGFVTFSSAPGSAAVEVALRRSIAASAASASVTEWTSRDVRGYFCTFSLVAGAEHGASALCDANHALVGDVPRLWLSAPDARERLARLAAASTPAAIDAALPDGDFAMGLWAEASSQLMLYRCPLATRAMLYVCEPGAWIAFASLPEPLLALPGVRSTIDEAALPSQLIMGWPGGMPPDATLFSRLRRLPGGHALRFTRDALSVREYWRLPAGEPPPFGPNDPEVPRELRRLLDAAVRRRVRGVERVGTQVSGGLDSSAVTALAQRQRDGDARLLAYTIRYHESDGSVRGPEEQRLASELPTFLGDLVVRELVHHKARRPYYLVQREYLERPLPDMVFKFGPDHRVLAAARADGCRIMLTGWGGDEMASARGNLHVLAMMMDRRWSLALENLLHPGGLPGLLGALRTHVAGPVWGALQPPARWSRESRRRLRDITRGKPLEDWFARLAPRRVAPSVRRARRERLSRAGFQVALELQDWLGQRSGIAVHHPLLDRDVVAFCDSMPAEWVAHLGVKRRAFLLAVDDLLPRTALERVKAPLARPADVVRWRVRYRAWHDRAVRDLAASNTWLHQYLNLGALAAAANELQTSEGSARDPVQRLAAGALIVARCGVSA